MSINSNLINNQHWCPLCPFYIYEIDEKVLINYVTYHKECWETSQRKRKSRGIAKVVKIDDKGPTQTKPTWKERYHTDPEYRERKLAIERARYKIRNMENPDRRKILTARIMLRYHNDPEYRAMRQARNRQYYNKNKAKK